MVNDEIVEAVRLTLRKCTLEGLSAIGHNPECYPLSKFVALLESMIPSADIIARSLFEEKEER